MAGLFSSRIADVRAISATLPTTLRDAFHFDYANFARQIYGATMTCRFASAAALMAFRVLRR